VDFALSGDQEALRDAAGELLDDYAGPAAVRAHLASGGPYDAKLWQAIVDQGWMAVELAEERGGLGLGMVEVAVLLEQVGRHTAPVPYLPSLLALGALVGAAERGVGDAEQWIEPLRTGTAVGCVAWSQAAAAIQAGRDSTLSGRSDPVIAAPVADVAVVVAGDELFAVDLSPAGRPVAEPSMDLTRSLAWLAVDRTPAIRLGGVEAVEELLDRGATAYAAEMLGGAGRVLEMTSQYAKDRVQFGKPIGSFQAVKHRCADMLVDVEGMRSTVWYAAWCLGAGDPGASVAASTAKVWCSDASRRVMASGLQVHGGIGFTWEHDLHLFLKRSQLDQLSFGDAPWHRDRLARLLRDRVRAGEPVI
jgi:alkylation response protein AidB-like acyl-CoA dehydrogenase